jgi:hypothetical protein
MFNSNPFSRAADAAIAELTSCDAREFYKVRSQQDLGLIIWAVGVVATMAYQLGVQARGFINAESDEKLRRLVLHAKGVDLVAPTLVLTPVAIAGYLPPVSEGKVQNYSRRARQCQKFAATLTRVEGEGVIVTPVGSVAHSVGRPKTTPRALRVGKTKAHLLYECHSIGLVPSRRATKADLVALLEGTRVFPRPKPTRVGGVGID